ncbi:MAG: HNH endonuclease [Endozoicomonas sp.]|uniref:HNH endonuclease n=1 Tax=Endozoicomonas sp. TaxID=1892382 RepID=UPI003D9B6C71
MAELTRFEKRALEKDREVLRILDTGRYRVMADGTIIDTNWRLTGKEKAIAVRTSVSGYLITNLSTGLEKPRQITVSVHRIVALALLPKPKGYRQVNHKNCNKLDNRLLNLEWVDRSQNMKHASAEGRLNIYQGQEHINSKLEVSDVIQIKKLLVDGISPTKIAAEFHVSRATIRSIRSGKNWKHVRVESDG